MKLLVLWEDQSATPNNFGPHELLLALVSDARALNERPDELKKRVQAVPCRGNANIEKRARAMKEHERVAVYDADKVRRLLQVAATTSETEVIALLAQRCDLIHTRVVLLHDSMEDVHAHVRAALAEPPLATKPSPAERDLAFRQLAWGAAPQRATFLASCLDFRRVRDLATDFLARNPG